MGELVELKITPKESTEELVARAIKLFDYIKERTIESFIAIPRVTLQAPRKEGWQTYLIAHLSIIGLLSSEALAALTDEELESLVEEQKDRILLLQGTFMRKHYDASLLPDIVPKIKLID